MLKGYDQGQANTGANTGASSNALQALSARLEELTQHAANNAERLERVLARAFGAGPDPENKSQPRAVSDGTVGELRERADDIGIWMNRLSSKIDVLETLV